MKIKINSSKHSSFSRSALLILIVLTSFFTTKSWGQENKKEELINVDSIRITPKTNADTIKYFLKSINASEIEFNENRKSKYSFRVKLKNKWVLMSEFWGLIENHSFSYETDEPQFLSVFEGYQKHSIEKYSLLIPDSIIELHMADLSFVERRNRRYIGNITTEKIYDKIPVDSLKITIGLDTIDEYFWDEERNEEIMEQYVYSYVKFLKLRREDKWALGCSDKGALFLLSGFHLSLIHI